MCGMSPVLHDVLQSLKDACLSTPDKLLRLVGIGAVQLHLGSERLQRLRVHLVRARLREEVIQSCRRSRLTEPPR